MQLARITAAEDIFERLEVTTLEQYVLCAIHDETTRDRASRFVFNATTGPEMLFAEVNASRWIVKCVTCSGAQFAARRPEWRRYWCTHCFNQAIGHRWAIVEWPSDEDADAIERALVARPDPATRNWKPHETPDDLLRENLAHGIGAES